MSSVQQPVAKVVRWLKRHAVPAVPTPQGELRMKMDLHRVPDQSPLFLR